MSPHPDNAISQLRHVSSDELLGMRKKSLLGLRIVRVTMLLMAACALVAVFVAPLGQAGLFLGVAAIVMGAAIHTKTKVLFIDLVLSEREQAS